MSQQVSIEIWFDFASTYSYPAVMRIGPLASAHGRGRESRHIRRADFRGRRGTFLGKRQAGIGLEMGDGQRGLTDVSITTIGAGMDYYIDGFVFPIRRDRVEEYKRVAEAVAEIWKEHGAIDYLEFVGDDMNREGTRSFVDLVAADDDETVVFGWVVFESREARDLTNDRVEADQRMADLVAPLIDPSTQVFDAKRMAYGGFRSLVRSPNTEDLR